MADEAPRQQGRAGVAAAIVLGFFIMNCSPMYLAWRPPIDLSDYRGDGRLAALEHPINPGFKIDFEPFSLDAPHSAVYRLDGLPRPRHHSPYQVGMLVELTAEEDREWPKVPAGLKADPIGKLTVRVRTRAGGVLLDAQGQVGGQSWSRFIDDGIFALLRSPPGTGDAISRFTSELVRDPEHLPATLEVEYAPGTGAPSRLAQVRLMAGGRD